MEIAAALAVLEHLLVVAKGRHLADMPYLPLTDGRGCVRGTNSDRVCGDELFALINSEHVALGIDLDGDTGAGAYVFGRSTTLRVSLIFHLVSGLRGDLTAGLNLFYRSQVKWLDIRHHQLIAGLDTPQFAAIQLFEEVNVDATFL